MFVIGIVSILPVGAEAKPVAFVSSDA